MSRLQEAGYPALVIPPAWRFSSQASSHGRNPYDGYARGWGLMYGDLRERVNAHPLWLEALAVTGPSLVTPDRLRNLFVLMSVFLERLDGHDVVEFGCYQGASLKFLGKVLQRLYPEARVFGFDTFSGMPDTQEALDLVRPGDFDETSYEMVSRDLQLHGLDNVILIKGRVEQTFPHAVRDRRFGLAHIDLDIHSAISHVHRTIWDRLAPGAYLVYDDATDPSCLGATQAIEEMIQARGLRSEQISPHFVFRAPGRSAEPSGARQDD